MAQSRRSSARSASLLLLLWTAALFAQAAPPQTVWLTPADHIAAGVEYFKSTDRTLVDPPAPIAVYLLKLDPAKVQLSSVLSNDEVAGAEPVQPIAERHHALAAVNGGFFNTANGEPVGLLKVSRELVSDTPLTKGAVAIRSPAKGRTELDFDQVSARVSLRFKLKGTTYTTEVAGVDTTRARGKLMLYTPAYHADTDTAANGTEWVLRGKPLKVTEIRRDLGKTPIPRDGVVLSFGGLDVPEPMSRVIVGQQIDFDTVWTTLNGLSVKRVADADHIVNGAGLLRVRGRVLSDWQIESLSGAAFVTMRHPRTLIGVDVRGDIWLVAIDGRQPDYSAGMNFAELQGLCDRLELRDALNLDGGGSTTMVVRGQVANKPSDVTGPRAVSDAILVTLRK